MIGRDIAQKDYYKVIDWRNKVFYLICERKDRYSWIRCYDWGKVIDQIYSSSHPIELIHNQIYAVNVETSTGVKMIKQLKRLPFSIYKDNK